MANSAGQLRNAHAKLAIDGSGVLPGPVLLVDDLVDTRWTLTVAGWLLRTHGSGEVHPFALAVASARDD
jgi:ATP-dependent DNA helicase RecQ